MLSETETNAPFLRKQGFDVGFLRRLRGMQHVPTLAADRVGAEELVACRAPDIGADAVFFREDGLRLERGKQNGSAAENMCLDFFILRTGLEFIQALQDSIFDARRHRQLRVVFVVERKVIKNLLAFDIHPAQAVGDDDRELKGERRVVGQARRNGAGMQQAVTVLMLQTFAIERRASGSRT